MSTKDNVGVFYVFTQDIEEYSKLENNLTLIYPSNKDFILPTIALEDEVFTDFQEGDLPLEDLEKLIYRFIEGDYGFVTQKEFQFNERARLKKGQKMFMIGRYFMNKKPLMLEIYCNFGVFYYAETQELMEPIIETELYAENLKRQEEGLEELTREDRICEMYFLDEDQTYPYEENPLIRIAGSLEDLFLIDEDDDDFMQRFEDWKKTLGNDEEE